jgi:predicted phage-related endonuclease
MTSTAVRTTVTEVTVTKTVRHLNKSADAIAKAYAKAKEDAKVIEAQKKALEEQLRNLMDGATVGYINGVKRIEILNRKLTKVDRKKLQEAYPEAYEATLVTTEYTIVDAE